MTTAIIEQNTDVEIIPFEETDDPTTKAHIVNPPMNVHIWKPGMTSKDVVDIARTTQSIVVALCGYEFIPKHNPDKHDACEVCLKIAGDIIKEMG